MSADVGLEQRHKELLEANGELSDNLATARGRIRALEAELAEARAAQRRCADEARADRNSLRAAHERTKAELADATKLAARKAETIEALLIENHRVIDERDAAQAEAAAMRTSLIAVQCWVIGDGEPSYTHARKDRARISAALSGTAGRALAARVQLLEAVLEWARKLSKQNKTKMQHARASQTEIELAKAVAALDEKGGG